MDDLLVQKYLVILRLVTSFFDVYEDCKRIKRRKTFSASYMLTLKSKIGLSGSQTVIIVLLIKYPYEVASRSYCQNRSCQPQICDVIKWKIMFTFICSNSPIVNTPNCYSTVDAKHYQSTMLSSTAQVDRHSPGLCQPPVATFTTRRLIITETAKTAVRSITPEVAEAHTLPAEIGVDHVTEQLPVEVPAAQPRCHTAQDVLTRYTLHICEF